MTTDNTRRCGLCPRPLDIPTDPLSTDCGGDCWGCIGAVEYQAGIGEPELSKVQNEIATGLRDAEGDPRASAAPSGATPS